MTTTLVALSLIFQPAPVVSHPEPTQPLETTWVSADALTAVISPTTSYFDWSTLPVPEPMVLSAATDLPALPDLPPSVPLTSPEPAPTPKTDRQLVDEIFGWPGAQLVQCESTWNRWAVGRFAERGLFQIHPLWIPEIRRLGWTWDDMFEAEPNIRMAAHIRRVQGLRAWTCFRG